jgi:hypothetical protein
MNSSLYRTNETLLNGFRGSYVRTTAPRVGAGPQAAFTQPKFNGIISSEPYLMFLFCMCLV